MIWGPKMLSLNDTICGTRDCSKVTSMSLPVSELKDGDGNVEGILVEEIALKLPVADPDAEEAAEDVAEGEW